ncbi:MAG: TIGR03668 family PPOX class F420-dependent oxidoreductase [Pseudonocardia sp.]|nr:TIGR03668 family PPOX class F420-dependent oxidoreductase [Pseudonocardia sp.]
MPSLDEDESRRRLTGERVARLATIRNTDGTPRLVPITFAVVDGLVCSAVDRVKPKTGTRLARLRDVDVDPRVGLLADRYDDDWTQLWWVRLDAVAAEHAAGDLRERALDALVEKYRPYRDDRPDGPVLVLTPTRWTGWTAS